MPAPTAASALNGIEFNFARAVGPALAGFIIASAGVSAAFTLNAISFVGVIVVVARWKRPVKQRTTPAETVVGATVAALRYVRYARSLRGIMLRSGVTMFFASALLALLPSVAHTVSGSPTAYGVLLGIALVQVRCSAPYDRCRGLALASRRRLWPRPAW